MTDADSEPVATAQSLGASFAALAGTEWQVDAIPEAIPVEEPIEAPPTRPVRPPLAEAVNEPTVPPTALQIVEALLFVGGLPVTPTQAGEAIRGLTPDQFREFVDALNRVYRAQNRPYGVVPSGEGYVLRVTSRYTPLREKLYGGPREARLNQTALDVLSMVAYRQPVSKTELDGVRGSESGAVLRQLVRLGLVVATRPDGSEPLFGTTERFLEVFRLKNLDDLPILGEPKRV